VLYALLTGALPFDRKTLQKAGVAEILKVIREQDPPHPSTRLSNLKDEAEKIATSRRTQAATLTKRLRKELEWIPLKAMRKERSQRYQSASELASDIRNYLSGVPLIAGPESAVYRVKKFARRNRALITGISAVLIVLLAGVVVSTIFAFGQARARAEAERQKMTVEAVNNFLNSDLLASIDPDEAKNREISVLEILDAASDKFGDRFKDAPIVEASIRNTLGITYRKLGNYEAAGPQLERSLAIRRERLGGEHPDTLHTASSLALLYAYQGRYKEAEPLYIETLEISRRVLGEEHPYTLNSMNNLTRFVGYLGLQGMERYKSSAYEEALATLKRVDEYRRTMLNNESRSSDVAYIAMSLHQLGRNQEAQASLAQLRQMFEGEQYTSEEHYLYEAEKLFAGENSKVYLVWESVKAGKLDEAAQLMEELRSRRDPNTAGSVDSVIKGLARAYYNRGKNAKYRGGSYGETIADYEAAIHTDPNYARAFSDLAYLQAACPEPEFRDAGKAVENATKACELTKWKDCRYIETLAAVYAEVDDFTSATKWQKEAIALLPKDKHAKWQVNYDARLKLYESGKPYRMGNLWSFSTGEVIGWWKFDETEGHIANDSSGNSLEGKLLGDAHIVSDPIRGNVLNLDGDGDYVSCGNSSDYDITGSITIVAWIKVNRFSSKWWQPIISKGDSSWRLQRYGSTDSIAFHCTGITSSSRKFFDSFGPIGVDGSININDGQWHHVAGIYDEKNIYLYVDSVLDNSEEARGTINTNNEPVYIGRNSEEGRRYWNGLIDDVRIYNYALDEAQIRTLLFETGGVQLTTPRPGNGSNLGVPAVVELRWNPSKDANVHHVYFGTDPNRMSLLGKVKDINFIQSPNLEKFQRYYWRVDEESSDGSTIKGDIWSFVVANMVGWWKFDEGRGEITYDSASNNNGIIKGSKTWISDPGRGWCLSFDGANDYVSIPHAPILNVDTITVVAWIKAETWTPEYWRGSIVSKDNWKQYSHGYVLRCGGSGRLSFVVGNGNGSPEAISKAVMDIGNWYNVVGTYDGSTIRIYINGAESGSTSANGLIVGSPYDLTIGTCTYTKDRLFRGMIDDVRIYSLCP
jgi:tetratricopeptide (TPR) repeat protein